MSLLKKLAVLSAVVVFMSVSSASAIAAQDRGGFLGPDTGQPLSSGQVFDEGEANVVVHCQSLIKFLAALGAWPDQDVTPGEYPGVVIVRRDSDGVITARAASVGKPCPAAGIIIVG
jgi:hypothetical protein